MRIIADSAIFKCCAIAVAFICFVPCSIDYYYDIINIEKSIGKINKMEKPVKGGRRKGSGRKRKPDGQKKIQWWVYLREEEVEKFGAAGGTREQVAGWVRAYPMARGETDRLLAQSPLVAKLLTYLEAQNTPKAEELAEKLLTLVVMRELDDLRIEGAIELPGGAYIV